MGALVVPGGFSPIAEEGKAENDRNRRDVHPYRPRCGSAGTIIADIQSLLPPRILSHKTKAPPTHLESRDARVLNHFPRSVSQSVSFVTVAVGRAHGCHGVGQVDTRAMRRRLRAALNAPWQKSSFAIPES